MACRTHGSLFDESVHLLSARQSASPALQAILKAFPLSDGPSSGTDQAQFSPSFSKRSTLDGFSIWIDHRSRNRDDHFRETQTILHRNQFSEGRRLVYERVVVFSTHSPEHINRLLDELKKIV